MSDKKKTPNNLPEADLGARLDELADAKREAAEQGQQSSFGRFMTRLGNDIRGLFSAAAEGVTTTRFKRGGAAMLLTVLFIAFVVLANLVAIVLTDRYAFLSPDLTANRIYTLSDVTLELLDTLDEHVEIDIIATESMCKSPDVSVDPYGHIPIAAELIERYAQHSSNIKIFYIDIAQNPGFLDLVPEYRDSIYDYSIIVRSEKRTRVTSFYEMLPSLTASAQTDSVSVDLASSLTETTISSLVKTVTLDTVPVVAYLDSLGGGDHIGNLLDALSLNGYEILTSSDFAFGYEPIPKEVQMVIIGSPEYDLTLNELDQLADFLDNNGNYGKSLFVFTSPYMPELPNLTSLLGEWGMELQRATVYEGDTSLVLPLQSADRFYATYMDSTYINESISAEKTVVSGALNIGIPQQTLGNIVVNGILCSSTSGFVSDFSTVFDPADYTAADGALRYIMAQSTLYSDTADGTRHSDVILAPSSLCDSNFFSASYVYSNFPLLMNICNSRCGIASESLDIAAKALASTDFSVSAASIVTITVIFGYAAPLIVAAAGFVVYIRRRRL